MRSRRTYRAASAHLRREPSAETVFLLPRRKYGADRSARLRQVIASERVKGEPLAEHITCSERETCEIRQFAHVEPKRLLVKVTEQMERLNAHIGAMQHPLEQAPVVLQPVGV